MKNKNNIYLFLVFLPFFLGCFTDIPKSNTIHSESREQSKRIKLYVGEYNLLPIGNICTFTGTISFDCWSEFAATTKNDFFFFPKRQQLDFYNFFLKIDKEICKGINDVEYRYSHKIEWKSTSCIQEPKLGYYFQIDRNTNLDSVKIKIRRSNDICIYRLIKRE